MTGLQVDHEYRNDCFSCHCVFIFIYNKNKNSSLQICFYVT